MRSTLSFTCFACCLVLLFSAATPTLNAAPPGDACSLLTKAQISAVVGVPVGDGSSVAGYSKMCTWKPSGGQAEGFQMVTLNLESAESYQAAKSMLQTVVNSPTNQSAQKSITMTAVSGLGDDALFSSVGGYSKLIVKKGDTVFQIVVYSAATIEKKRDLEKALAAKVLSGL